MYIVGMNKEKIKNFLQNCTEKQFKIVCCRNRYPIDIYTLDFYDYKDQLCKLKRVIVYDDSLKNGKLVKDVIFASEEDERKFLFEGYGLRYLYCTPEYGKYLSDKYHLNERVTWTEPTIYQHELFKENHRIARYLEKRPFDPSLLEKYKNIFIDINPIIITEVKEND